MMAGNTLRLFVGIDVGDAWTERLSATADGLRGSLGRDVRWVRPELYHVTVVFLGSQAPDAVDAIAAAMSDAVAGLDTFRLHLTDLRRIGGHEHGALVAGVHDPSKRLQRLRAGVDRELSRQGVAFDSKRLVPHVTLGRQRSRSGPFELRPISLLDAPPLTVREIGLVKSDLLPTGPRHTTIATARLGPQEGM